MPVDRDLAAELARNVANVFADAEQRLLAALARQINDDARKANQPLAAAYALIRQRTTRVLARLQSDATGTAQKALLEAFATGASAAVEELDRLGSDRRRDWLGRRSRIVGAINRLFGVTRRREVMLADELTELRSALPGIDAIMALLQELTQRFSSTHLHVLRWQQDAYRDAVTGPAVDMLAGTKTRLQATQAVWDKLASQGITGFTDKSGRNWDLTSYAEMTTRTASSHAAVEGHVDQLRRQGVDLVQVSDSPEECPICRPFEGKVLALVGPAGPRQAEHGIDDGRMVTVDVYATLAGAIARGLFHPNCTHRLVMYLPGVTRTPTGTENAQGYDDRQELRRLEREVRKAKREEAAAITPEARQAKARKVRERQKAIRDHVEETGQFRRRDREQLPPPLPGDPSPMQGPVRPPAPARRKTQPPMDGFDELAKRDSRIVHRPEPEPEPEPAVSDADRATLDAFAGHRVGDLVREMTPDRSRDSDIQEAIRDAFDGRDFAGFTLDIDDVSPLPGRTYVEGDVRRDGLTVGRFTRVLIRDDDGTLSVTHDYLSISPDYQGQGFASAFNEALYDWYRASGVDYVKVHADIDVGGYTWARHGFDFEDETDAESILDRLRDAMDDEDDLDALEEARDVLARSESEPFGSEDYPTAYEISQLGRDDGDTTWLGLRAMLGSDWYGLRKP